MLQNQTNARLKHTDIHPQALTNDRGKKSVATSAPRSGLNSTTTTSTTSKQNRRIPDGMASTTRSSAGFANRTVFNPVYVPTVVEKSIEDFVSTSLGPADTLNEVCVPIEPHVDQSETSVTSEALDYLDHIVHFLQTEAYTRAKLERKCHITVVMCHMFVVLLMLIDVIATVISNENLIGITFPPHSVTVATAMFAVLNLFIMQLGRQVSKREKLHHHIYVDTSALYSHFVRKRSYYNHDGVITGNEFLDLQKMFKMYSERRQRIILDGNGNTVTDEVLMAKVISNSSPVVQTSTKNETKANYHQSDPIPKNLDPIEKGLMSTVL